ncbi:PGF-pre-PGF domain-containing protein [Candidatus Woesearchaeota archaeon]|nr:PGF-pre-PGF domain-containing protein [Candidatus Woesearchaeota archaeon]
MRKNYLNLIFLILVLIDVAYASFSISLVSPENNAFLNYNDPINFSFNVTGNYSSYNCSIYTNRTSSWAINLTNQSVQNNTLSVFSLNSFQDSSYIWNIYCENNNTEENWSITNFTFIVDTISPNWSNNSAYPGSGVIYNSSREYFQFNITWNDTNLYSVWIEHNFNGSLHNYSDVFNLSNYVFYYNYTNLAADTYSWKMYANDSAGNLAYTSNFSYIVSRANSSVNLTLNGTNSNVSIEQLQTVNITGYLLQGEENIVLYKNGSLINNGSSPLSNITLFNMPGLYNITLLYPESENYSSDYVTYWVTVNDTTDPNITVNSPENNSFYSTNSIQINITTDDQSTCRYKLNNNSYVNISASLAVTHVTTLPVLSNQLYNLTINCTNNVNLFSAQMINFTVDTVLPVINITYPLENQIISSLDINFNYTLNDTYLDSAWYLIDYNSTKVFLNSTASYILNNKTQDFDYPGKHVLLISANDSADNTYNLTRIFYLNSSLNISKWEMDILAYSDNITTIQSFNSTNNNLSDTLSVYQNISLEINLSSISITIVNISVLDADWSSKFKVYDSNQDFENSVMADVGTNATDYVFFANFSDFYNNTDEYYGIIRLPHNSSYYTHLYYCPEDDLLQCYNFTTKCSSYFSSNSSPCYNDTGDYAYVYVPHFSAVFGDNDTIAPNITITYPENNSVLLNGFNNNLTVQSNEKVVCTYNLNTSSSYSSLSEVNNYLYRKTFNDEQDDVWPDSDYSLTVVCNDTNDNSRTAYVYFSVNDTTSPLITYAPDASGTESATITVTTNEPTRCTYTIGSSETTYYLPNATRMLQHQKSVEDSGTYYVTCGDLAYNNATTSISVTIGEDDDEEEEDDETTSSSSSSSSTSSSGSTRVSKVWEEMSEGEYTMDISSTGIALTKITFDVINEKNRSVTISVEQRDELPDSYDELGDIVYQYIRISAYRLNEDDLSDVKIKFKISNDWFKSNNADRATVKLHRYSTDWKELKTKLDDTDSNYVYYEAESPGFSYFGINAKKSTTQPGSSDINSGNQGTNGTLSGEPSITGNVVQNQTATDKDTLLNQIADKPFNFIWPLFFIIIFSSVVAFFIYQNKYSVVTDKDLGDLREYIQKCESEGIKFEQIKNVLVKAGWKPMLVDLILHDVHLPHDKTEKLVRYIDYTLKKGLSKPQIKENLKKVGWQHKVIEEAFDYVK